MPTGAGRALTWDPYVGWLLMRCFGVSWEDINNKRRYIQEVPHCSESTGVQRWVRLHETWPNNLHKPDCISHAVMALCPDPVKHRHFNRTPASPTQTVQFNEWNKLTSGIPCGNAHCGTNIVCVNLGPGGVINTTARLSRPLLICVNNNNENNAYINLYSAIKNKQLSI